MTPMMTNLGRLGSRMNLIFDPERRRVFHGALGLFLDEPADVTIGIEDDRGRRFILPFSRHGTPMDLTEMRLSPTSVTWIGTCIPLHIMLEVKFTAPFWPQDEQTSLWPGYIINVTLRPMKRIRWHGRPPQPKSVRVVFGIDRPNTTFSPGRDHLELSYTTALSPNSSDYAGGASSRQVQSEKKADAHDWIGPAGAGWKVRDGMLSADVPLHGGEVTELPPLLWVGHSQSEVFEAGELPGKFHYLRYWPTLKDAVKFGRRQHEDLLAKSRRFDALINGSALSETANQLFAQSMQCYLMNTWWVDLANPQPEIRNPQSEEWFSVWEGNCLFNSTVDVEYNTSLFYFLLWPKLLGMTLAEWAGHLKPNAHGPGRYLDHDMGAGCRANGVSYHHTMGVEEAANYLLLLLGHVKFNGDAAILRNAAVRQAAVDLVEYLLWTDQRGRGFPTEDVANTIDDGAPAVQFGKEQTYLGVKRMAALRAALSLDGLLDPALARKAASAIKLTKKTLAEQVWLKDHYAVCIDKDASGVRDAWSGQPIGGGEIEGWDDYHIYSSNGLLLLLMTGSLTDRELVAPMKADIASALPRSLGPYGCSHNAGDPLNVWLSQNIWRDCIAHYLGQSIPDLTPRYWNMQVWSNTAGQGKCFIDTYLNNNLSMYPRGITCAGYLMSLAGLTIDRPAGIVKLKPAIADGRIPLLPLADWKSGKVPVLVATGGKYQIEDDGPIKRKKLRVQM